MAGGSSKGDKGKGKEPQGKKRKISSKSVNLLPPIHLTRNECEEMGLPLPPPHYGLNLHTTKPSLNFSGANLERYKTLRKLKVLPMRYFDINVMEKLGILNEIRRSLNTCGWLSWIDMHEPTCEDLVYEFLATFELRYKIEGGEKTDFRLSFRMMGLWFDVRLSEVCDWFGWEYNNGVHKRQFGFAKSFWRKISSAPNWAASRSKATCITNPMFSYIHRVMVHSFYGNEGSNSSISVKELAILYWLDEQKPIDWGRLFVKRLEELSRRKGPGSLIVGGFLTHIAIHLGIIDRTHSPISWMEGNRTVATVDYDELKHMSVIVGDCDNFRWVGFKQQREKESDAIEGCEARLDDEPLRIVYNSVDPTHGPDLAFSEPQQAYLQQRFTSLETSMQGYFDRQLLEQRTYFDQQLEAQRTHIDERFSSLQQSQQQWTEQYFGPLLSGFQNMGLGTSSSPLPPPHPSHMADDA